MARDRLGWWIAPGCPVRRVCLVVVEADTALQYKRLVARRLGLRQVRALDELVESAHEASYTP